MPFFEYNYIDSAVFKNYYKQDSDNPAQAINVGKKTF